MIYFFIFFISVFFIDRATKIRGPLSIVFYFLSILIPATLGGLRDETIGTDVLVYGRSIWNFCEAYPGSQFFNKVPHINNFEIGYLYLTYVISSVFDNFHWFLFFISFIECTLVILGLSFYRTSGLLFYRTSGLSFYKTKLPITVGYTIYLFMFYPQSFNAIRQSLAGAIILFAYHFIPKKKWFFYIVFVFLATLFHKTAILAMIVPMIQLWIGRKTNYKTIFLPIITASIVVFFANSIIGQYGFLAGEKYQAYLSSYKYGASFSLSSLGLVPIIILFIMTKIFKVSTEFALFTILLAFAFILDQLSMISVFLGRISMYFKMSIVYSLPLFIKWIYDSGFVKSKHILYLSTSSFAIFYFVMIYIIAGLSDVYPYSSFFKILN